MHGVQRVEPQSTYMILQYFSGHGYTVHGVQCGESQSTHWILEFFSDVFHDPMSGTSINPMDLGILQ